MTRMGGMSITGLEDHRAGLGSSKGTRGVLRSSPTAPELTSLPNLLITQPPGAETRQQVLITAAVVRSGKDTGKILGCIIWGLQTDASAEWQPNLLLTGFS